MCLPLLCSSFHSLLIVVDGLSQTVPADNTAQTFLFSFPNLRESSLHDYPPSRQYTTENVFEANEITDLFYFHPRFHPFYKQRYVNQWL